MKHTQGKVNVRISGNRCSIETEPKGEVNYGIQLLSMEPGLSCAIEGFKDFPILPEGARKANAERIAALWNAADGMTTEEAVKALTNYHELQKAVENVFDKMPKVGG